MVQDATVLKLVLDRHRVQLMCNAWNNYENRWLVQPMFIQPLTDEAHPYPCGTARNVPSGEPVRDEAGAIIANLVSPAGS